MEWDEFSLLRDGEMSKDQIAKLQIIFDFYDRLPSKELKEEILTLMEKQHAMVPGEFDLRLQTFAERAKAAFFQESGGPYPASNSLASVH